VTDEKSKGGLIKTRHRLKGQPPTTEYSHVTFHARLAVAPLSPFGFDAGRPFGARAPPNT